MADRIVIMGPGAVGSYVGAFLVQAGEDDITFIDMWPEHVEKMRAAGLRASGSQGDFTVPVNAMHLTDAQNITEPFDYAFITTKSYDTEWATHFVKRYVKDDGAFVSIQNCWNDPIIADIVGPERQLGCIASHIEVALWEPAHVNRGGAPGRDHGHTVFRVGEYTGAVTARSEALAAKLDHIDAAYATDNLPGERWAKLCQNGMGNAISAMSQLGSQEMAGDTRIRRIRINLAKEGAQVGLAQGLKVVEINGTPAEFWADADTGDVFEELDGKLSQAGGRVNWLASMAQDVHKGRKSEVDFMNGLICEKGRETGVATPYHDAIVEAMRLVDSKAIAPGPENVDRVIRAIEG